MTTKLFPLLGYLKPLGSCLKECHEMFSKLLFKNPCPELKRLNRIFSVDFQLIIYTEKNRLGYEEILIVTSKYSGSVGTFEETLQRHFPPQFWFIFHCCDQKVFFHFAEMGKIVNYLETAPEETKDEEAELIKSFDMIGRYEIRYLIDQVRYYSNCRNSVEITNTHILFEQTDDEEIDFSIFPPDFFVQKG